MTAYVKPEVFGSKAKLKENLDGGLVWITEPFPWKDEIHLAKDCPVGFRKVVTNHPLRTKFAEIEKTPKGWKIS